MTDNALTTTADAVIVGVPMMDETEARQIVSNIKRHFDAARRELLELHDREGWRALGYPSWRDCAQSEFGQSVAYLYRQLAAAKIEQALDSPIGEIPESHLRPLSLLDSPDQQRQAYAVATADGPATAKKVQQAVDASLGTTPDDLRRNGVQLTKHGSWFKATGYSGVMNGWSSDNAEPWDLAVAAAREEIARRTAAAAAPATPDPAQYLDARERFLALGWTLTRDGVQFKLFDPQGKHYATSTMDNHLRTLATFEAGAAKRASAAAPTLADLDASLPKALQNAGYYWKSAQPLIIAHNDGWTGEAGTIATAISLVADREKARSAKTSSDMIALPPFPTDDLPALLKSIAFVLEQWPEATRGQAAPALGLLRAIGRKALEASEPAASVRLACPTCGERILNGVWGELNECGSCYHARQRVVPQLPLLAEPPEITTVEQLMAAPASPLDPIRADVEAVSDWLMIDGWTHDETRAQLVTLSDVRRRLELLSDAPDVSDWDYDELSGAIGELEIEIAGLLPAEARV